MWTLVVIVLLSAGVQSGTSSSVHSIDKFSSEQKCQAAAKTIAVPAGTTGVTGRYDVLTYCVEQ